MASREHIDISIVVVSYNTQGLLRSCIRTVYEHRDDLRVEVLVVDNASRDCSADMIAAEFPEVVLFRNTVNVGFGKANNQALRKARGDYILLLNSDTELSPHALRDCIRYLKQNPKVGVLTCKLVMANGSLDLACRRSFPTPFIALCRLLGLSYLFPKSRLFAKYNLTYLDPDETYEVDAVVGAFMLMPREAFLEVGLLDEVFFMYGEDLDWCYRFRQAGYRIVYFPKVKILHLKGASSKKRPVWIIGEFHRAMKLFYAKHYARRHFFLLNTMVYTGISMHFVFQFLGNQLKVKTQR